MTFAGLQMEVQCLFVGYCDFEAYLERGGDMDNVDTTTGRIGVTNDDNIDFPDVSTVRHDVIWTFFIYK